MTGLRVHDLSVGFGSTPVLHELSFSLARGDRVGLIGESGSGKSIAALAIMGLLPEGADSTGSVELDGNQLVGLPERELADLRGLRMAMVFQEPMTALDPVMTVGNQLREAITLHQNLDRGAVTAKAFELLCTVELPDPERAMRSYPHQLSGGQRQRVVLAMALANDPGLLICDEPTTALDVTIQRRVLELIERLVTERSSALLFITHDLAVVSELCDTVLVLYGGRLVESGPLAEVFGDPRHPYTAGLLAASNIAGVNPGELLPTIEGAVPGLGQFPPGCPFRGRCERESSACSSLPPSTAEPGGRTYACFHPLGSAS